MKQSGWWLVLGLAVCLGCEQEPASMPQAGLVAHVDASNFDAMVLGSQVPVLVDFYADWCGPCKMLAPLLEEIASQNPNAKIVKVNVDHNRQLAARYQVRGIPSLKVFKNGQIVAEHLGLANKKQLESLLAQ